MTNIVKKEYKPRVGTKSHKIFSLDINSSRRFDIEEKDSIYSLISRIQRKTGNKYAKKSTAKHFIITRVS